MQVLIWFVLCILVSCMAINRRPGAFTVFLISIFLSPLIGLIVALFSKKKVAPPPMPEIVDTKETPEDVEIITPNKESVSQFDEGFSLHEQKEEDITRVIYCPNCGKVIDVDSTFCSHCGQKVQ